MKPGDRLLWFWKRKRGLSDTRVHEVARTREGRAGTEFAFSCDASDRWRADYDDEDIEIVRRRVQCERCIAASTTGTVRA